MNFGGIQSNPHTRKSYPGNTAGQAELWGGLGPELWSQHQIAPGPCCVGPFPIHRSAWSRGRFMIGHHTSKPRPLLASGLQPWHQNDSAYLGWLSVNNWKSAHQENVYWGGILGTGALRWPLSPRLASWPGMLPWDEAKDTKYQSKQVNKQQMLQWKANFLLVLSWPFINQGFKLSLIYINTFPDATSCF